MRFFEVASSHQDTRGNTLKGGRMDFAVRGDTNDPKVKAGKEGAFKAAVEGRVDQGTHLKPAVVERILVADKKIYNVQTICRRC